MCVPHLPNIWCSAHQGTKASIGHLPLPGAHPGTHSQQGGQRQPSEASTTCLSISLNLKRTGRGPAPRWALVCWEKSGSSDPLHPPTAGRLKSQGEESTVFSSCFPLKQLTRALVTSTHLFSRMQLPSGPTWIQGKVNCRVTRQNGPGQWPHLPSLQSPAHLFLKCPKPISTSKSWPCCSHSQDTPPLIFASPAPSQQASPSWNDSPPEELPLTGLLSNLHSTFRFHRNTLAHSLPSLYLHLPLRCLSDSPLEFEHLKSKSLAFLVCCCILKF